MIKGIQTRCRPVCTHADQCIRVDLPLDKNCGKSVLEYRVPGSPGRRGSRVARLLGRWAAGPSRVCF